MRDTAKAIAAGDYGRRVAVGSRDEVGELALSFNEMAKRLEQEMQAIRRDQRELRAILGSMVEGVVAVDVEERVVLVNEAACEILGIDAEQVAGHPVWEAVRLPAVVEALDRAVKQGDVQTDELRLQAGGTERFIALNASPLLGEGGARRGAVLVLDDVTERRKLDKMRGDFITNVSHELKTPIASIQGLVETILDDDEMGAGQRAEFLQRVMRQMRRLGDMVGEMLALSRLESREAPVATQALDLGDSLREVLGDASPSAAERDVTVDLDLGEEPLSIDGEPEAVRRIAANLLDNAINYSDEGGRVLVRARRTGDDVVLEVHDDGPGIPPDKQQRIFERFYRVEEGRARGRGGTGLGLAIVKHLVQALGGRIDLESHEGAGSVFRVTFRALR
jgi:two-component system phosphate regulon sensor histidine kinase PhoR